MPISKENCGECLLSLNNELLPELLPQHSDAHGIVLSHGSHLEKFLTHMEACLGESWPSCFVGQEFSETHNNVGTQDYYRNGGAEGNKKILGGEALGCIWSFQVS